MGGGVVLIDGQPVVVLLLRRGGNRSRLGLSLLLTMGQALVVLLGSCMLPRGLIMLGVLLLVGIKMLGLKHGVGVGSGQIHPRVKRGQGSRWRARNGDTGR